MRYFDGSNSSKTVRDEMGLASLDFVVLYVARVDSMKAHDLVISAAKLCPEIKFIFAGLGTDRLTCQTTSLDWDFEETCLQFLMHRIGL